MKTPIPSAGARLRTLGNLALSTTALSLALFATPATAAEIGDVRINEVDADTPTQPANDSMEFIELYDGGDGNTALDGLVVVLFNGNGDASYEAVDLDGFSTDADGFFVIGSANTPNVSITLPNSTIQNGAEAVALYMGDEGDFPNGTAPTTADLVDVLPYGVNDPEDSALVSALTPKGVTTLSQIDEGANGNSANESMARFPDGGFSFDTTLWVVQTPTPGATNAPPLEISVGIDPFNIGETGNNTTSTVTVTLDEPAPAGGLTVELENDDPTEVTMPDSVFIAENQTETTFQLDAVDDLWPDGNQMVTITAQAPGFQNGAGLVTVVDDGDTDPGIVLNEIYADVQFQNGETTDDEFVEIVNNSGSPLDLSGFQIKCFAAISGFTAAEHVFPAGTVLPQDCAIVVFGPNADVPGGRVAAFGGAFVQKASNPGSRGLNLNDGGDFVSIQNAAGLEVAGHTFGASDDMGSFRRDPDLTGLFALGFTTPGFQIDGFTPFCPLPDQITVTISPDPATEGGANGTLTVSVPSNVGANTVIALSSSDESEATVAPEVTILAGTDTITTPVMFPDDSVEDGDVLVTITASSNELLSGDTMFIVADDSNDIPPIKINEILFDPGDVVDANGDGTVNFGQDEFVELVNISGGPLDISNWELHESDSGLRHLFPAGTVIATDCAIVVFGGGAPTGSFGGATVQLASEGALGLTNDPGDTITLYDGDPNAGGSVVTEVAYDGDLAFGESINLEPDELLGTNYASHGAVLGAVGLASPGTRVNGVDPFCNTPANAYSDWATSNNVIGGPDDDDDKDGKSNLVEYALGCDPGTPDPGDLLNPAFNGDSQFEIDIDKGAEAGSDPLLSFSAEASTDLENWSDAEIAITRNNGNTFTAHYTGNADAVYIRLVLTLVVP